MQIETYRVGLYQANCYFLTDLDRLIIIDPGARFARLIEMLKDRRPTAILLTHGHLDHIGAVDELVKQYACPVYIGRNDVPLLQDPELNFSRNHNIRVNSKVIPLDEGHYKLGGFDVAVYDTPGHTAGSVVYLIDNALFTGDTLFCENVGRTDLPTGNDNQLKHSLTLFTQFPFNTPVYPGHEGPTTIGHEIEHNPYF